MDGEEFPHGAVAPKQELRRRLLSERRALDPTTLGADDGERLAAHVLALPQVRRGACVAAYVSTGGEPPTGRLVEALRTAGVRVLLPVLLADDDLDWAAYAGPDVFTTGRRGLREPASPALGVDAVAHCDLVLVPGLAVSRAGHRLGRGGGSYDRALARVPPTTPTVVLLHPHEVGVEVPVEPHDRRVDAALTRDGLTCLG